MWLVGKVCAGGLKLPSGVMLIRSESAIGLTLNGVADSQAEAAVFVGLNVGR